MAWHWDCEDDEEALGLATIFERAGVPVTLGINDTGGAVLRTSEAHAEEAALLRQRLLGSYVRRIGVERRTALDRRESWGTWALLGAAVVLLTVVILSL